MAEQNPTIEILEKETDWSSSIGVPMSISEAEVYQRIEKITPSLLDNGVLRIKAIIKLFAVISTDKEQKAIFNPARVFSNEVEVNSFVNLHAGIKKEDIISIEHRGEIKNYVLRPDNIIVKGTLKLKISYLVQLVLDGTVIDFSSRTPINGATLNVMSINQRELIASTSTGNNGKFSIKNLPPGIYLIEATTDSHKPDQKVGVIKNHDTVNFVLHR